MINPNEPAFPCIEYRGGYGLEARAYIAIHSSVTWHDAQHKYNHAYRENGTVQQIAEFLAEMRVAAADALIAELNKTTTE